MPVLNCTVIYPGVAFSAAIGVQLDKAGNGSGSVVFKTDTSGPNYTCDDGAVTTGPLAITPLAQNHDQDGDGCTDWDELDPALPDHDPFNPNDCADSDGDGCPDVKEQQTAPGSQASGGLRDYLNPWDYFNPTHDGVNRVDDILAVVQQYFKDDNDANPGLSPYAPGYSPGTDRTSLGPNVWNLGVGNGQQRVNDILASVHQYFHDCS